LFSRLIENLLKNSIEAGSTKVDIELSSTRLILIDNGGGISPNHLEDINSGNFYSTKRSDRGLGLEFIHDFCKENGCEVFIRRNSDDLRSIGVSVELDFESLLKAAGEFAV
jgi:signal transduction histidine kinase